MRGHGLRPEVAGLLAGVAAAIALGLAASAQAPQFSRSLEDLPLLAGLAETVGGHVFETAEGRLVQVRAEGGASASTIAAAYEPALEALGWRRVDIAAPGPDPEAHILAFARAGERLTLTLTETGRGRTLALFDVRPQERRRAAGGQGEADHGL